MSLDIGDALKDGAERTVARTGLALMAGFAVLGLATAVLQQTYLQWYAEWAAGMDALGPGFEVPAMPLALELPVGVTVALWLALALLAEAFRIVAVRTMVGDHRDAIPPSLFTRNIGLATLNGFVGGIVVAVLVGLGSILVLPGIFLAVAFVFVRQEIAVNDENFVDAMVGSWRLTAGNRVEVAVLGIVWLTLLLLALVAGAVVNAVLPAGSPVGPLVGVLVRVPVTVFVVATAARAYVQLGGRRGGEPATDEPGGDDEEEEEWPDPPGVEV